MPPICIGLSQNANWIWFKSYKVISYFVGFLVINGLEIYFKLYDIHVKIFLKSQQSVISSPFKFFKRFKLLGFEKSKILIKNKRQFIYGKMINDQIKCLRKNDMQHNNKNMLCVYARMFQFNWKGLSYLFCKICLMKRVGSIALS